MSIGFLRSMLWGRLRPEMIALIEVDGKEGTKGGEAVEVVRGMCECLVAEESSKVVEGCRVGTVLSSIFRLLAPPPDV